MNFPAGPDWFILVTGGLAGEVAYYHQYFAG